MSGDAPVVDVQSAVHTQVLNRVNTGALSPEITDLRCPLLRRSCPMS